ncbi:MAG: hypothetical protein HYX67_01170 [Candidatus Melainabacteria bacterium]|nr:hypothetical protein [Candidatus Melainabacteria bacterium]
MVRTGGAVQPISNHQVIPKVVQQLITLRIMMFIVGSVFLGGGLLFVKQSLDDAKNVIESVLFALMGVMTGLLLCFWAIAGIPD